MSLDLSLLPPNEQHKCQGNNPFMESWSSKKKKFDRGNSRRHFLACGLKQDTYSVSLLSNAFKSETKKTPI